jgi:hypothetical protein
MSTPFDILDEEERARNALVPRFEAPASELVDPLVDHVDAVDWLATGAGAAPPALERSGYGAAGPAFDLEDPRYQIPDPPRRSAPIGGLIAAAIADLALNKGRSLPQLIGAAATRPGELDAENWAMQRQAALDRASIARQQARAAHAQEVDPRLMAIREAELNARLQSLALSNRRLDARVDGSRVAEAEPSPEDRSTPAPPLTPTQQLARERFEYQKLKDLKSESDDPTPADRARAEKSYAEAAEKFRREQKFNLDAAKAVAKAQGIVATSPEGDIEGIGMWDSRMADAFPGIVSERSRDMASARSWLQQMLLRQETGAAAPRDEKAELAIRAGSRPGATEAEFKTALRAASGILRSRIRGGRVGREDAADAVLRETGVYPWVANGMELPRIRKDVDARQGLGTTTGTPPRLPDILDGMGVRFGPGGSR